jgi:GTP-binding protein EngB required for normal cell division
MTMALDAYRSKGLEAIGIDSKNKFNLTICGNSGTGKSSLINVLLDLEASADRAAPVDSKECTMEATPYYLPEYPYVVLWDLPGCGTLTHPSSTYIDKNFLLLFDAVVVLTATRITEGEIPVIALLKQLRRRVYIVRSMIDVELEKSAKIPRADALAKLQAGFTDSLFKNLKLYEGSLSTAVYKFADLLRGKRDLGLNEIFYISTLKFARACLPADDADALPVDQAVFYASMEQSTTALVNELMRVLKLRQR